MLLLSLGCLVRLAFISLLFTSSSSSSSKLRCSFDVDLCNFTNTGAFDWTRRSGSTPSGGTGPTGDHTSGIGNYMYVESSWPNNPLEGPFVLEVAVKDGVSGASFWYNMYGSSGMGTLQVDTSSDGVTWDTRWSKHGAQGQPWQRADVAVDDVSAVHLRFLATTGTSYQSDIAIDDANVTRRTTSSPTLSPQPSITPAPSFVATPAPTPTPTTVGVTTSAQLTVELQTTSTQALFLEADIYVTTTPILISRNVTLHGEGHAIDGSGSTICLIISGTQAFALDLTMTNCLGGDYGGALIIDNGGRAYLTRCIISKSTAKYGAGFYVAPGSRLVLTLTNVTQNKGFNGGGGRNSGNLRLVSCIFSDNAASYSGGGVSTWSYNGTLVAIDSVFMRNQGQEGGGAAIFASHAEFTNCFLLDNVAESGGAMGVYSSSVVSFSACRLLRNEGTTGGALYVAGSGTVATLDGCDVSDNVARGSSGGAFSIVSGSVVLSNSAVRNNSAIGAEFTLVRNNSACTARGGCFTSSNFPNDYSDFDSCMFLSGKNGSLRVNSFNTETIYDHITIGGVEYSGASGPDGVQVEKGQIISWHADTALVSSGFQICYTVNSLGGGVYISGGSMSMSNVAFLHNAASLWGGGVTLSGGVATLADVTFAGNNAVLGNDVYYESGSFSASALSLDPVSDLNLNSFGGPSASSATCSSPCEVGQFGVCSTPPGSDNCWVNCECTDCPAGRVSNDTGSTSANSCSYCGEGQISESGSTDCSSCPSGKFATDDPNDTTGGLTRQVTRGATACGKCPAGYYSDKASTLVCQACAAGLTSTLGSSSCSPCPAGTRSFEGSSACLLCPANTYGDEAGSAFCHPCDIIGNGFASPPGSLSCTECRAGFYRPPNSAACFACPASAQCQTESGALLPAPSQGFWLDTSDASRFEELEIFPCPRLTCTGDFPSSSDVSQFNAVSCWAPENIAQCDQNLLLCTKGAAGPLCGSCEEEYVYSSASRACLPCSVGIARAVFTLGGLLVVLALLFLSQSNSPSIQACFKLPACMDKWFVVGMARKVDTGVLRVLLSNYQIISSIAFTVDVTLPYPFADMLGALNVLSFNFSVLQCTTSTYFRFVFMWSLFPMAIAVVNAITFFVRRYRLRSWALANAPDSSKSSLGAFGGGGCEFGIARQHEKDHESEQALHELELHDALVGQKEQQLIGDHVGFFLLVTYLVLPPASRIQLQALDCVELKGAGIFLRADTSIDCNSDSYATFAAYDYILLACFLSIPLVWAFFLWSKRRELNPMAFPPLGKEPGMSRHSTAAMRRKASSGGEGVGGQEDSSSVRKLVQWCQRRLGLGGSGISSRNQGASSSASSNATTGGGNGPEQAWIKAEDRQLVLLAERDANPLLKPYKFLFHVYSLDFFWFECLEMTRRILFIGAIPLVSARPSRRAAFGLAMSLASVVLYRETEPFRRRATNLLAHVAQYTVLLTFGAALAIETDLSKNVNPTVLGGSLVVVNILVLGLALGLGAWRHQREDRAEWGWRRGLNSQEFAVLQAVMTNASSAGRGGEAGARNKSSSYGGGEAGGRGGDFQRGIELSGNSDMKSRLQEKSQLQKQQGQGKAPGGDQQKQKKKKNQRRRSQQEEDSATATVLQQHLVKAKDVKLLKKVGAGAYGEVFKGSYSSHTTAAAKGQARHPQAVAVAVKTMLRVTEVSARAFRREILLTATLRHPNIVRGARKKKGEVDGGVKPAMKGYSFIPLYSLRQVNFVGACWEQELCCLVLEWIPKGSMQDLLESAAASAASASSSSVAASAMDVSSGDSASAAAAAAAAADSALVSPFSLAPSQSSVGLSLRWEDPLLKLASDVARGMAYLHSKHYFDEQDGEWKDGILHRDLKPDNCLVTEFLSAKIADFGTSRARARTRTSTTGGGGGGDDRSDNFAVDGSGGGDFEDENLTMTAVGTPVYCAPEISRGEAYDEKVDVYSFGMTLLTMCVGKGDIAYFLAMRYKEAFKRKQRPHQLMRVMRPIINGTWRPLAASTRTTSNTNPLSPEKTGDEASFSSSSSSSSSSVGSETTAIAEAEETAAAAAAAPVLPPPPEWEGVVPVGVVDLIVKCLDHDPKMRPSFSECLAMLEGPIRNQVLNASSFDYSVAQIPSLPSPLRVTTPVLPPPASAPVSAPPTSPPVFASSPPSWNPNTASATANNETSGGERRRASGGGRGTGDDDNASKGDDVEAGLYPSSMSTSADRRLLQHFINPILTPPRQQPTVATHSLDSAGGAENGGGGGSGSGGGGGVETFAVRNRTGTVSMTEYTVV